ncbi:class I SAM-dependent methyltransferase [Desulfosarcina sp.]|nr:class I SAM-dependent methyltransferase [Desulfosarcina sp.]
MKEFWDSRYSEKEYAYGIEPNEFFKKTLAKLQLKGNILFPAEGEGRNAVFAAKMGLQVNAFDLSEEGKKKANQLAKSNNVKINYSVGELSEQAYEENSFATIVLIFAHFPPPLRLKMHQQLSKLLKPNGIIIIEGFSKNQMKFHETNPLAGGPRNMDMLFSKEEIKNDFPGFEILQLKEEVVELNEGNYHKGKSSVIQFVGRKIV